MNILNQHQTIMKSFMIQLAKFQSGHLVQASSWTIVQKPQTLFAKVYPSGSLGLTAILCAMPVMLTQKACPRSPRRRGSA